MTNLPSVTWCPECRSFLSSSPVAGNVGVRTSKADADAANDSASHAMQTLVVTAEPVPPSPTGPMQCECLNWARADEYLRFSGHHPKCEHATDQMKLARQLIDRLIAGIEAWASDADGVHHDCWDAYRDACAATLLSATRGELRGD